MSKKFIIWAVNTLAEKKMKKVIKYKRENGYHNPEIKIHYDLWSNLISQEEAIKDERMVRFFSNLRDIICTHLDEDTYYLLRFYHLLHLHFENQDLFESAMKREYGYYHYVTLLKEKEQLDKVMDEELEKLR